MFLSRATPYYTTLVIPPPPPKNNINKVKIKNWEKTFLETFLWEKKLIFLIAFYVFYKSCGTKGIGDPGPLHIKPMTHAEKEEMFEDEHRKSRLPGYTVEDNPILGEL